MLQHNNGNKNLINDYLKFVISWKQCARTGSVKKLSLLFLMLAIPFLFVNTSMSAENLSYDQGGRIRTGLKMFRSMLLADRDIEKKTNKQSETDVVFLYQSNASKAKHLARSFVRMGRMQNKGQIKGSHIKVHLTRELDFIQETQLKPAAIFLVDPLIESKVQAVARYGKEHQIITFSPYEGDVENGILGGLVVESRIHPFINMKTLEESNVRIKPFFLKVAQAYDPNKIK